MKYFRLSAACLVCMAAANAQSFTGRWVAKMSPDDEVREIVVALSVESDGKVTGYILAPQYEERIIEGKAEGNSLTFVGEREANNNTRQKRNYSAVAEGGKLKLTMPGRGA